MSRKRHDPTQLYACKNCSRSFASPDFNNPIWAYFELLLDFDPLSYCSVECYLGAAKRFLRGSAWQQARTALETYLQRPITPFVRLLAVPPTRDEEQFTESSNKRWKYSEDGESGH